MIIITKANKSDMSLDFYIEHKMCALEWRLNAMIVKNNDMSNKLDRSKLHLLIRKYPYIPFNN